MIENGVNVSAAGPLNQQTIHVAAQNRDATAILRVLLENGADIEAKHGPDNPLLKAVFKGNFENAKFLLEKGKQALGCG